MYVPSHQMHNVLNHFSKQLSQNRNATGRRNEVQKPPVDKINISMEGQRQATMEKVSNEIYNKITGGAAKNQMQRMDRQAEVKTEDEKSVEKQGDKEFVFNVINNINQKQKNSLPMEDSSALAKKLEKLAKEAVDKKVESWI